MPDNLRHDHETEPCRRWYALTIEAWLGILGGLLLVFAIFPAVFNTGWYGVRLVLFYLDVRYWPWWYWTIACCLFFAVCAAVKMYQEKKERDARQRRRSVGRRGEG
jgi:membrane protein implicated in regulation of membrane protease activity